LAPILNSYWSRRCLRHVLLALAPGIISASVYAALPPPDIRQRLSLASAYCAFFYLAASLAIGPYRVWRKRPNPVSFDLRRDLGIWAALLAIFHSVIGLTVHLRGKMWMYFLSSLQPIHIQDSLFGFANYSGVIAGLLFLFLLSISNDLALRELGTARWKSFQRWTYWAALITAIHGIAYQVIEKRITGWILLFSSLLSMTLIIQLKGVWHYRRRKTLKLG
jgi:sulfoxide reductase heme-binding subunit YedZ